VAAAVPKEIKERQRENDANQEAVRINMKNRQVRTFNAGVA